MSFFADRPIELPTRQPVLVWVESLQGAGHLHVADKLARALTRASAQVHIATSSDWRAPDLGYGEGVVHAYPESLRIIHDQATGTYRTTNGTAIGDAHGWQHQRYLKFMDIVERVRPAAIITEHWPFALGNLDFEILQGVADIKQQWPDTLIYGSVRDVLLANSSSAGGTQAAAAAAINQHFHSIFVHGDDGFIPLGRSFDQAELIRHKLVYTGYLGQELPPRQKAKPLIKRPIIVSSGGGRYPEGYQLYKTSIGAYANLSAKAGLRRHPLQILVSHAYTEQEFGEISAIAAEASPNIHVQRNLPAEAFRRAVSNSALCISLCGYNTAAEVTSAGVPAVLASYNGSREQAFRANEFAKLHGIELLPSDRLDCATTLSDKMLAAARAMNTSNRGRPSLKLGGEDVTARTVVADLNQRSHRSGDKSTIGLHWVAGTPAKIVKPKEDVYAV